MDEEYPDILIAKNSLTATQIKTIPITMHTGQIKTTMQTNVIQITMSIGIAGKKMMIDKRDDYVWKV